MITTQHKNRITMQQAHNIYLTKFQQQSFEGGRISGCSQSKHWNGSTPICRIGGGQKRLSNIANNGKNYKRPSELQHLECINRVSQFKKKSKRGTLQLRATQHSCIACNTESGSTVCPDIRGGRFYLSHPLCLTTRKSQYPKTA